MASSDKPHWLKCTIWQGVFVKTFLRDQPDCILWAASTCISTQCCDRPDQPINSFTPTIRRSGPDLFYIRSVGVHMLGLVSSFDSVYTGSCQGRAGQDEDGGEWGKVKCQLLPCQMFSHLNHLTVEHHHCVFASFPLLLQLESLRRKRTGWAGQREERRLGWNTVMSTLAANTTSVLHPPSTTQTAWAKQFSQSINDQCQLGRARNL